MRPFMLSINRLRVTQTPSDYIIKSKIIPEIKKLPQPELVSDDASPINPKEAVICLQQEIAYVDLLNPLSNIKYIGTKNVNSCFALYIHNPTNHLLIHIDAFNRNTNLTDRISAFSDKENIEVYIVGGDENDGNSIKNLLFIINELFTVADKLNIKINITKQKILVNNKFTDNPRYHFVYSKIIEAADIICRQYYHSPITEEEDYKYFSVNDFRVKHVVLESNCSYLSDCLIGAQELYDISDPKCKSSLNDLSKIKSVYANKIEFLNAIKNLFSKEGFNILQNLFNEINDRHLCDFAFDVDNKKIHVIKNKLETKNEKIRAIYCIDPARQSYFVCYDGKYNQWFSPVLSPTFKSNFKTIQNHIKDNKGSRRLIALIMGISPDIFFINEIVKCSVDVIATRNTCLNSSTFFQDKTDWKNRYEKGSVTNTNLQILNEITGLTFKAKIRHRPAYTVDAMIKFNSDAEAESMKNLLKDKNIITHIISLHENEKMLCVPAINAGEYARNIYKASFAKK